MSQSFCECGCGELVRGRFQRGHNKRNGIVDDYVVDETTGCWVWQRSRRETGYGKVTVGGRSRRAHRVYYERYVGPIPDGMDLDHTCHNGTDCAGGHQCLHRRCVNPDHMEPVTRTQNARRGAKTKLTLEIARRIKHGAESGAALARELGIGESTVWAIRSGRSWKDV
jgi:hypothetical protein